MTLESAVKDAAKWLIIPITATALSFLSPNYAKAQVNVSGIVTTVPEQRPSKAKLIFTNKNTGQRTETWSDSLTGEYNTQLQTGPYNMEIRDSTRYRMLDSTFTVTGDRRDTTETIKTFRVNPIATGGYSDNGLVLIRAYTNTYPGSPDLIAEFWKYQDRPIKFWANNDSIPNPNYRTWLNNAINNITTSTDSAVTFQETNIMPDTGGVGIRFHWVLNNQMPTPGLTGETVWRRRYADRSPKLVDIYINKEVSGNRQKTVIREILRTLGYYANTHDPTSPLYYNGAQADVLNSDDELIVKTTYRIKNIPKNMAVYDTTEVNTISSVKIDDKTTADEFKLYQSYPNPVNGTATLRYELPEQAEVQIDLFNIIGQHIKTLTKEKQTNGTYEEKIRTEGLASGAYVIKMTAKNHDGFHMKTEKINVIK